MLFSLIHPKCLILETFKGSAFQEHLTVSSWDSSSLDAFVHACFHVFINNNMTQLHRV